jgi:hypothetical protein
MKHFTLYLGNSDIDNMIKHLLEAWSTNTPDVTLDYKSIHANPAGVVRLGITELPALVMDDEVIAQGTPENWITPLLGRLVAWHRADH